jgi:hypothetical protein
VAAGDMCGYYRRQVMARHLLRKPKTLQFARFLTKIAKNLAMRCANLKRTRQRPWHGFVDRKLKSLSHFRGGVCKLREARWVGATTVCVKLLLFCHLGVCVCVRVREGERA